MAGASLLALLDDIAVILDDISIMTKVAAKKTAGVLGDDLALNANQVQGVRAERELPVVWAVAKGSAINKAILVPLALILSAVAQKTGWNALITIPLMLGGLYLCFEGAEKVLHKLLHSKAEDDAHAKELTQAFEDPSIDMVQFERDKIKGAIRTDFILSAEIIVIALGVVEKMDLLRQALVLSAIAILMTIGVYGLVALIVKIDDIGLFLTRKKEAWKQKLGRFLVDATAPLMKFLSIAGTLAMFLVGGSIIAHNIDAIHHIQHDLVHHLPSKLLGNMTFELVFGFLIGCMVVGLFTIFNKLRGAEAH